MAVKADAERIRETVGEGMEEFAVAGVEGVCELVHPGTFDHIALGLVFVGDGADGTLSGFDVFGVEGGKVLDDFEQMFGVFVAQASAKLHQWATTDVAEGDREFTKTDLADQKDEFFGGEMSEGRQVQGGGVVFGGFREALLYTDFDLFCDLGSDGAELLGDALGELSWEGLVDALDGVAGESLEDHCDDLGGFVLKEFGKPSGIVLFEFAAVAVRDQAFDLLDKLGEKLFARGFAELAGDGFEFFGFVFGEKTKKREVFFAFEGEKRQQEHGLLFGEMLDEMPHQSASFGREKEQSATLRRGFV